LAVSGIERSKNTIAFYVRRSTPRRLYQLGLLALRALFDLGDSFEIVTFGENDLPDLGIPVKITHAGILNAESLIEALSKMHSGFGFIRNKLLSSSERNDGLWFTSG
jgi:hypothetical protein